MRTKEEISQKIKDMKHIDIFGVIAPKLLSRLTFEEAKSFLKERTTKEDWGQPLPQDEKIIKAEMLEYMPFAWEKANNRRGLSANRSMLHMHGWLWLLNMNAAAEQMLSYTFYGKPQLRAICEYFAWDWTQWDDGKWTKEEFETGVKPPKTVTPLQKD